MSSDFIVSGVLKLRSVIVTIIYLVIWKILRIFPGLSSSITRVLMDVGGSVVKYNTVPGGGNVNVGTFLNLLWWPLGYFPIMPHMAQGTKHKAQGLDKAGTRHGQAGTIKNSRGKQGQLGPGRDRLSLLVIYWHCLSLLGIFFVPAYPKHDPALGMGKGPKWTLELVNYRLESRPSPSESRLGFRLDSKLGSTKPHHAIIEKIIDLTIDFK